MNLLLLFETDRRSGAQGASGEFAVAGTRAKHLQSVLKAEVGRKVRVGLLEGPLGSAVVLAIGAGEARLLATLEEGIPPRPPTDLILAVPRPKSLKKLLPEVTALGVDRLVLIRTWRVDRAYLTAPILSPEAHLPLLIDGLMQARSTRLPAVSFEPRLMSFLEERAPAMLAGARAFVAHPSAEKTLAEERPGKERVVIAIGPEGGFIGEELASFERAGFRALSLGPRVLRVETACVALLAQLELVRRIQRGGSSTGSRMAD